MPALDLEFDAGRFTAKLDAMGPNVRQAIAAAVGPLAQDIAADARAIAVAHIHYLGRKPGQYLASILGGVSVKDKRVLGYVRSGDPLAHLLEYGTAERFRKSMRSARETIAAARTGSTGAMPAFPALHPAIEGRRADIESAIEAAAKGAMA